MQLWNIYLDLHLSIDFFLAGNFCPTNSAFTWLENDAFLAQQAILLTNVKTLLQNFCFRLNASKLLFFSTSISAPQTWAWERRAGARASLDFEFDIFLITFQKKNVFLSFEWLNWNFTTVGLPDRSQSYLLKKSIFPLEKNPSVAHAKA